SSTRRQRTSRSSSRPSLSSSTIRPARRAAAAPAAGTSPFRAAAAPPPAPPPPSRAARHVPGEAAPDDALGVVDATRGEAVEEAPCAPSVRRFEGRHPARLLGLLRLGWLGGLLLRSGE